MKIKIAIYTLLLCTPVISQEDPVEGEVIMINPKDPDPMVYKRKSKILYLGLDGDGNATVYDIKCPELIRVKKYKYYSEKYLISKGCKKRAYEEPE